MSRENLKQAVQFVEAIPQGAHTATTLNGTGVDRRGFQELVAVASYGSIGSSATVDIKIQHSDDDITYADITGAVFDQAVDATDDSTSHAIRVNLDGAERYIRAVSVTATASSDFGVIFALGAARDRAVTASIVYDADVDA